MLSQVPNPSVAALYEDALVYETGSAITSSGALTAYSGKKTGRSPLDKRIVQEPSSENEIWWGPVNKPMTPDVSDLSAKYLHVYILLSLPPALVPPRPQCVCIEHAYLPCRRIAIMRDVMFRLSSGANSGLTSLPCYPAFWLRLPLCYRQPYLAKNSHSPKFLHRHVNI